MEDYLLRAMQGTLIKTNYVRYKIVKDNRDDLFV